MKPMPGFVEIINRIENEIGNQYTGGAIAWADDNHRNAWSNAIARFEIALVKYRETGGVEAAQREGQMYLATCLDLIKKYKATQNQNETMDFMNYLETRT